MPPRKKKPLLPGSRRRKHPETGLHPDAEICSWKLGRFDLRDAERLIELLKEKGIPCLVDIILLYNERQFHDGNKMEVFVPEDRFQEGNNLSSTLFPVETPPR
jgi:hypothetical protein